MSEGNTSISIRPKCTPPFMEDPTRNGKCIRYVFAQLLHRPDTADLEMLIYGQLFPILLVFVVVTNLFVVLVLSKQHMKSPTNMLLLYMAVADLCVGLIPFPFTFTYFTLGNYQRAYTRRSWCLMQHYLMGVFPPICHNIAMLLAVLITVQKYISIRWPLKAALWCTKRQVRCASAVIVLASFLWGLPHGLDREKTFVINRNVSDQPNNRTMFKVCYHTYRPLVYRLGTDRWHNAFLWIRVVGFITVPCLMLLVLNVLLIRRIKVADEELNASRHCRNSIRRKNQTVMTGYMLAVIVSIFLVVNFPNAIYLVVMSIQVTFKVELISRRSSLLFYVMPVQNMMIIASYPLNFAVYILMSSKFRRTFVGLFTCSADRQAAFNTGISTTAFQASIIHRGSLSFSFRRHWLQHKRRASLAQNESKSVTTPLLNGRDSQPLNRLEVPESSSSDQLNKLGRRAFRSRQRPQNQDRCSSSPVSPDLLARAVSPTLLTTSNDDYDHNLLGILHDRRRLLSEGNNRQWLEAIEERNSLPLDEPHSIRSSSKDRMTTMTTTESPLWLFELEKQRELSESAEVLLLPEGMKRGKSELTVTTGAENRTAKGTSVSDTELFV